ncbi:MAG: HPP family protein [Dehalococcoidia bacterium]|nr:HPP family protein [Dehalococcoidia bacterium]
MKSYISKMRGGPRTSPRIGLKDTLWSTGSAFFGVAAVVLVNVWVLKDTDLVLLVGSFGASAVLVYGTIESPLAQPRNLIGGHIVSATAGVTVYLLLPEQVWLAAPLAVAAAIALMLLTHTLHPPGGATALIAVVGSPEIHALGYMYAITPVAVGATILLTVALLANNVPRHRKYPQFWF